MTPEERITSMRHMAHDSMSQCITRAAHNTDPIQRGMWLRELDRLTERWAAYKRYVRGEELA